MLKRSCRAALSRKIGNVSQVPRRISFETLDRITG
jgi:hypothetical protein